ncbi:hypothetical protein ACWD3I_49250, partial [Streptomyces sp. NPDC002817]
MDEMGKLQEDLDHANAWDLDAPADAGRPSWISTTLRVVWVGVPGSLDRHPHPPCPARRVHGAGCGPGRHPSPPQGSYRTV